MANTYSTSTAFCKTRLSVVKSTYQPHPKTKRINIFFKRGNTTRYIINLSSMFQIYIRHVGLMLILYVTHH